MKISEGSPQEHPSSKGILARDSELPFSVYYPSLRVRTGVLALRVVKTGVEPEEFEIQEVVT